jgi:hypothetical protein
MLERVIEAFARGSAAASSPGSGARSRSWSTRKGGQQRTFWYRAIGLAVALLGAALWSIDAKLQTASAGWILPTELARLLRPGILSTKESIVLTK